MDNENRQEMGEKINYIKTMAKLLSEDKDYWEIWELATHLQMDIDDLVKSVDIRIHSENVTKAKKAIKCLNEKGINFMFIEMDGIRFIKNDNQEAMICENPFIIK